MNPEISSTKPFTIVSISEMLDGSALVYPSDNYTWEQAYY